MGTEETLIWTGCYTADRNGNGERHHCPGSGRRRPTRVRRLGRGSQLTVFPRVASNASRDLRRSRGRQDRAGVPPCTGDTTLEAFGEPWPAGEATCHVAADPQGRFIVATCWGDGQVILYELDHDGAITSRTSAAAAVDPHSTAPVDDERPSRAHSSLMLPDGRVMTTDLGHDMVRVWQYVPGEGLQPDHQVVLPKGSGPRHMARHRSGTVFVDTEYSVEVAAVGWNRTAPTS
jgi:6-phosphogluconolactonase